MTDRNIDEVSGRVKEAAGALTGNQQLKDQGRLEQVKSSVKHAVENAVDKVSDTISGHKGHGGQD